jgi:hypothetical protein
MNALPQSTGARHAPAQPVSSEQRTPVVRDPERFRRDGPPLRARRGGPGADPDEEAVDQPARIRRPAMPPLVSRPRHGTGRATAGGDDRLRGPINWPCRPPSSPTTRSGIRLAANMRSNCKDTDTHTTVDLASWVASQNLNGCRPPCFLFRGGTRGWSLAGDDPVCSRRARPRPIRGLASNRGLGATGAQCPRTAGAGSRPALGGGAPRRLSSSRLPLAFSRPANRF